MYCQKCRTPLKADRSLETLNPAAFDLLVGSASRSQRKSAKTSNIHYPPERKNLYDQTVQEPQSSLYKRTVPAPATDDGNHTEKDQSSTINTDMSFIEITESQVVPAPKNGQEKPTQAKPLDKTKSMDKTEDTSLSSQLRRQEKLFSILSSYSDIDHPVCAECSMMLVSAWNARLASATRERDAYASFLKSLQHNSTGTYSVSSQKDLDSVVQEEEEAFEQLTQLEAERKTLDAELARLEEESRQLDREEEQFWKKRNVFDDQLHEMEIDLISLQQKYSQDQQQLERLQRTNVYNDTFCIGHDGYFGTINGLRLGRLPSQNVEWAEINAAWGQTLLLLSTVAERLSFSFLSYRLRPLGSTSRIEKLEWPQQSPEMSRNPGLRQAAPTNPPPKVTQLDLFSSGDMPLGRVFNHRRFDAGMVAFLDCLSQLGLFVERTSKLPSVRTATPVGQSNSVILPYAIDGDKIGGISIRLGVGFSQDENFTKACKYALTCCKFLLAHVSNMESTKGGRIVI